MTTNCGSLFSVEAERTLQWPELLVVQGVPATHSASLAAACIGLGALRRKRASGMGCFLEFWCLHRAGGFAPQTCIGDVLFSQVLAPRAPSGLQRVKLKFGKTPAAHLPRQCASGNCRFSTFELRRVQQQSWEFPVADQSSKNRNSPMHIGPANVHRGTSGFWKTPAAGD